MHHGTVDVPLIQSSILSVPPLCRDDRLAPNRAEMAKLARYLHDGDVKTLMYGGNALFYHVGVNEYAALLDALEETAPEDAWVIPSIGPDYGRMMEQAAVLRGRRFPAAMVLPATFPVTSEGLEIGIRHAAEAIGEPVIAYVKHEGGLEPDQLARLVNEGVACAVKYAIVRDDPSKDDFLDRLLDGVGSADRVISGIGERPVIDHWAKGLRAFTSGSVCVAPALSNEIRLALQNGDTAKAQQLRAHFIPLEDLRDGISPIRVLHEAVDGAGIAATGPMLPLMTRLSGQSAAEVATVASALAALNTPTRHAAE
ncbi:MAG: dihydrodipicolinate synthase family protein [Pseudomonadota bacterium]